MRLPWPPDSSASARLTPIRVVIGVAVLVELGVLAGIRLWAADPTGGDLCRDAVAVRRILRGQNPYVPIHGCGTLYNLPHPPAFLLLIGPFAALPVWLGALLWDLGALCALAVSLVLIVRELHLRVSPLVLAGLLALLILWPPLLDTLLEAQISPVLLLLFVLAWRWALRGESGRAGAALGVATALRLFPGLALGYFLLRRDWRAVVWGGVAFLACELAALPFIGIGGLVAYMTREAPSTSGEWMINAHNVSAWGLAGMLFAGSQVARPLVDAPAVAQPAALILLAILVVALAARTLTQRHLSLARDQATLLAYVPAMLLASPLTWTHYFVVLLLPMVVLGWRAGWLGGTPASRGETDGLLQAGWVMGVTAILIWLNDFLARLPTGGHRPAWYALFVLALPCYALICLAVGLLTLSPSPTRSDVSVVLDRPAPGNATGTPAGTPAGARPAAPE